MKWTLFWVHELRRLLTFVVGYALIRTTTETTIRGDWPPVGMLPVLLLPGHLDPVFPTMRGDKQLGYQIGKLISLGHSTQSSLP